MSFSCFGLQKRSRKTKLSTGERWCWEAWTSSLLCLTPHCWMLSRSLFPPSLSCSSLNALGYLCPHSCLTPHWMHSRSLSPLSCLTPHWLHSVSLSPHPYLTPHCLDALWVPVPLLLSHSSLSGCSPGTCPPTPVSLLTGCTPGAYTPTPSQHSFYRSLCLGSGG